MNTQTKKCTDPRQLTAAHITDQELICLESFVKPACSASSPGVSRVLDTPRPVRIPMQINDSTDRFYTLYSAILCFRADLLHSCQCDSEWVTVASHSVFWIFTEVVYLHLQCCFVTNFHLCKMQLGLHIKNGALPPTVPPGHHIKGEVSALIIM